MKKNNNDFEYIKEKFDNDNITAPDIFDESNITNILNGKEPKKIKFYKKKGFKAAVSLAACFALILTTTGIVANIASTPKLFEPENVELPTQIEQSTDTEISGIKSFESYDELKAMLKKIDTPNLYASSGIIFGYSAADIKGDSVAMETVDEAATDNSTGESANSYAETYKQVDNVDEADIIKNNGKYIFWLHISDQTIKIYEGKKLISQIKDFSRDEIADGKYANINNMYLVGDKLVLNCSIDEFMSDKKDGGTFDYISSLSAAYIYDISDIRSPKMVHHFEQTGYFVDSRMVGNTLYLLSNHGDFSGNIVFPYTCCDESKGFYLPYNDIYYPENPKSKNYLVISAIDVESFDKSEVKSKAFLGYTDTIYCTDHSMYITVSDGEQQQIIKAELKGNNIKFTATGKVKGYINDQFSMDEKDGYFRIATTIYDSKTEKEKNCLYILDKELNQVGKTSGFAKGESIKAVKYIGDMAYVITYEQTDPLFVIDLSNPEAPEIKGSVKITGFSSLLTPVDENTLLGIGYSTETMEYYDVERINGLKLALFDISNPEKPKVLDSYTINDASSEAQYNHHALVVNKDMNYFAIPFELNHYTDDEYSNEIIQSGALLFRADNGKLIVSKDFVESKTETDYSLRCTYINDKLYILSDMADIEEYTVSEKNFN